MWGIHVASLFHAHLIPFLDKVALTSLNTKADLNLSFKTDFLTELHVFQSTLSFGAGIKYDLAGFSTGKPKPSNKEHVKILVIYRRVLALWSDCVILCGA